MKKSVLLITGMILLLIVFFHSFSLADRGLTISKMKSEQRIALVIGNGRYQSSALQNPPNDAQAIAAALKDCGFTVIKKINVNKREMKEAIRLFGNRIRGGGVGLFYFAGHGLQINGTNYLVPVGADVQSETEVEYACIAAGFVLGKMHEAKNRLNIIILDACRNNPFARSFSRSDIKGLARMDAPNGSLLCYATSPGSVAADGSGQNGIYTKALLKYMKLPGLPIERVFKFVRDEVMRNSGDKQVPWESTSLRGDFYFSMPGQNDITLPDNQSASFDEIERDRQRQKELERLRLEEEQKKRAAREKWFLWLSARTIEYKKAKEYDSDRYVSRENKITTWQTFLTAVKSDDPYSTEDDAMQLYAQQRLYYWQKWRPEPTKRPYRPPVSSGGYIDNGDGTVTDTRTGLMWTKEDSWNATGGCMDWEASKKYVSSLTTGGYSDWRLPTIDELKGIFSEKNPKVKAGYKNGKYSVYLPSVFPSGGAIWYWSSEEAGSCCARYMNFLNGYVHNLYRAYCYDSGVRSVRRP